MPEYEVQAARVKGQHPLEEAFGQLVKATVPRVPLVPDEARTHHRRQRQRDEGRKLAIVIVTQ